MTPLQKLVRLAELVRAPRTPEAIDGIEALLADVQLPPAYLAQHSDPGVWAAAAHEALGVSEATLLAWLRGAMTAAFHSGTDHGATLARQDSQNTARAVLDALRLVVQLIDGRGLRNIQIRDTNDPDNPPVALRQHLVEVLRAAGEEVE